MAIQIVRAILKVNIDLTDKSSHFPRSLEVILELQQCAGVSINVKIRRFNCLKSTLPPGKIRLDLIEWSAANCGINLAASLTAKIHCVVLDVK